VGGTLSPARLCADAQPLPSAGRDGGSQPEPGHAVAQCQLQCWVQSLSPAGGASAAGAVSGILVDGEHWGLELCRYLHLNPVRHQRYGLGRKSRQRDRAGVGREVRAEQWAERVEALRQYRWSSYRSYIGLEKAPEWLVCQELLRRVEAGKPGRQRSYQRYVEEAAAAGGTRRAGLRLYGRQSDRDAAVTLKFLGNNVDGREGIEKTVDLPAGGSLAYSDVLGGLFGVTSGWGAIAMSPTLPGLCMAGQTSTPGNGGTFGQSVPAVATHDLITCATPGSISAIREDASFRTNLILANASDFSLAVEVALFDSSGQSLGARQYTLLPRGMIQVNSVVAQGFGIVSGLAGARLSLEVLTPGGAISAYASMIDNGTNDPRTLLPTLHRRFLPEATVFAEGLFSGIISAGMTFTPDGTTLYLGSIGNNKSDAAGLEILTSKLENGTWTPPVVAGFSKSYGGRIHDFGPHISPDGLKLFFVSGRPISGTAIKDDDIWVMDKTENGWSEPRNLGYPVNTSNQEYMPSVTRDGTLYFSLLGDLYSSRLTAGKYSPPVKLGYPINVPTYDENGPFITPDGNLLLFTSDRPGGFGGYDLYVSTKINEVWSAPKNLGSKVNSVLWDRAPTLSPDGKTLFFNREEIVNNTRVSSEIYQIDASLLGLD
jgi:hypothetical protein